MELVIVPLTNDYMTTSLSKKLGIPSLCFVLTEKVATQLRFDKKSDFEDRDETQANEQDDGDGD